MTDLVEPHPHLSDNPMDNGEMHYAKLNENGVVVNVCTCDDPEVAAKLGYTVQITGTHAHIGWTTADGGKTWSDTRETELARVKALHRRGII